MTRWAWLVLAFVGVVPGCGDDQDPAAARELLARVRAADYRSWQRAPGYETRQDAQSPHSDRVDIFVNDVIAQALSGGVSLTAWPIGSIVVKDGFSSGDLELIAIMDRRDTDWFFAEYDSEGESDFSGFPDTCTGCHTADNDRINAFELPSGE